MQPLTEATSLGFGGRVDSLKVHGAIHHNQRLIEDLCILGDLPRLIGCDRILSLGSGRREHRQGHHQDYKNSCYCLFHVSSPVTNAEIKLIYPDEL